MRNPVLLAILGVVFFLQTGCAVGATVTRPRLPTIVIGEVPPAPPAPEHRPLPPPPPPPRILGRGEAISIGQQWCRANHWDCHLDEAKLKRGDGVWKVEFDAWRDRSHGHGRGKGVHRKKSSVELRIDAYNGRILHVDVDR